MNQPYRSLHGVIPESAFDDDLPSQGPRSPKLGETGNTGQSDIATRIATLKGDRAAKYSDDEPRDERGRWTIGTAGVSATRHNEYPIAIHARNSPNRGKVEAAMQGIPDSHLNAVGQVNVVVRDTVTGSTGQQAVAGRNTYDQHSRVNSVQIADRVMVGGSYRNNKDPGGTAVHEMGHALDNSQNLTPQFISQLRADAGKMNAGEQYLAQYWLGRDREMFAEGYKIAFSNQGKGAFGMGQKRAEKVFASSIAAMRAWSPGK